MKHKTRLLIPVFIVVVTTYSTLCQSDIIPPQSTNGSEKSKETEEPIYTFLKDCKDSITNDNAAFSELNCPALGDYQVEITKQSPQYFNIHLIKDDKKISTDFTVVTKNNPVEPGKAIEWHFQNSNQKYMIFRLSWGTEAEPFTMRQYLVVNLVTDEDICVLATVDVKNNKNPNQKARDLITKVFKQTKICPKTVLAY